MRNPLRMTKSKFILTTICLLNFNSSFWIRWGSESQLAVVDFKTSWTAHAFSGDNYNYYMEQRLKEDLSSLFQLGQEMTRESQPSPGIGNYRQVSQRANKIRKLAGRIKSALTLGNQTPEQKSTKALSLESPSPEGLRGEIEEIGNLVHKIHRCYARRGRHTLNAKLQTELYAEVDTLENLASHVKQNADELSQMNFRKPFQADLWGQNIPPSIGDKVGQPKVNIPNPLGRQGQQKSKESAQSPGASSQDLEVRNFLNDYVKKFSSRNLEQIGAYYLQDPSLMVYWESKELRGWEAVQSELQKVFQKVDSFKLTLSDLDIHVFGRFAWATGNYRRESTEAGKSTAKEGRTTLVMQKMRANWYILHEHDSVRSN